MEYLFITLLQSNYEDWGIKSILIAGLISLAGVIIYLYKSKESMIKEKDLIMQQTLKEKDDRIMKIINNHQEDLKEANNDMKVFVEKYHQFTEHLKEVVNARK